MYEIQLLRSKITLSANHICTLIKSKTILMKATVRSRITRVLLLCITVFGSFVADAQLKVGDNPTNIQKSSILELESTKQGLLLPRISDTADINALTPPNGMIIYFTPDNSLRLRSAGAWKKIADMSAATANWSLKGNSGLDSAGNFIGTLDGQPFTIKTNNAARVIVSSDGNIGIGTTTPSAKLNVDGSVKFENLGASTTDVEVLVLANDGSVYKRTMSSSAFTNAIKAINGIQKQTLTIKASPSTSVDTVTVTNTAADSTIAIYLPVMDSTALTSTKPYGLMTYEDWQKTQTSIQTLTIGTVASSSTVKGASINITGQSREIVLHPADGSNAGIVSTGAQTFAGDKTFANNVAVTGNATIGGTANITGATTIDGNLTLNSLSNNTSADSVLVVNNGVIEKRKVSESAFGNAIRSINANRDTAQTIAFTTTGTDLTISTNSSDSIFLNVPSASASARGVVTTGSQTFGGVKTFQDTVSAAKTFKVGATGNANSTVQVAGSISMTIKTVTADATIDATDNTILVNASSAAVTLTLPSATGIAGRIYTIKKIAGGLDNDVTISPAGSSTIDGGTSYKIYNDWTFVTLQTDGTNWYIIKK